MKKHLVSMLASLLAATTIFGACTGTAEAAGGPNTNISWSENFKIMRQNMSKKRAFNEDGIAWLIVQSTETYDNYNAIVNTNGEIVYLSDPLDFGYSDPDSVVTTPFINGHAAIYTYSNFVVVNTEGEAIYRNTDDKMHIYESFTDGTCLFLRHESGFDHDYYRLYVMDPHLNMKETSIDLDSDDRNKNNSMYVMGDGVFLEDGKEYSKIINTKDGFCRRFEGSYETADDNNIYVCISSYSDNYYYAISKDLLYDPNTSLVIDDYGRIDFQDAYVQVSYGEIERLKGLRSVASYPEFSEGVQYISKKYMSGDYAAIFMQGVDGNSYATILNENGEMQYEPKQLRYNMADLQQPWYAQPFYDHMADTTSAYGYIFNHAPNDDDMMIIAPDGTEKELGVDNLEGLEDVSFAYQDGSLRLAIGGGYILTGEYNMAYYSTDGTKIIDSFTANYNSDGQLVYTDQSGAKRVAGITYDVAAATPEPAQPETVQRNYITVNNFSIEGKWKNVGDTTWGQVQSGAIVTFNGQNCNFLSPMDTYAFYKDGDDYKLDTTSLLADTVSSTVKIVDEDNIDVYRGSTVLELTRVG